MDDQIKRLFALVDGVACTACRKVVDGVPRIISRSPEFCCPPCAAEQQAKEEAEKDRQAWKGRLEGAGLADQSRILAALGITQRIPRPEIRTDGAWRKAAECVRGLREKDPGFVVILSGDSFCGKSTSAAWLSWATGGRYLPREEWSELGRYGGDRDEQAHEIERIIRRRGVVTLDEVCPMVGQGRTLDTRIEIGVVDAIVKGRHAGGRSTVCTTNALGNEWLANYGTVGAAITRRTLDTFGPRTSGFVVCS